jgi:hypothetical protein
MEKVAEYYDKTAISDAYTFVMGAFFFFFVLCHAQPNFDDSTRSRHQDESLYEALDQSSPR